MSSPDKNNLSHSSNDTTKNKNNTSSSSNNNKNENTTGDKRQDLLNGMYCFCLHPSSCSKCGTPLSSQSETQAAMKVLMGQRDESEDSSSSIPQRPSLSNVFGIGPLLVSHIPESAKRTTTTASPDDVGVHVGIDEAGRGSVMGPMVYGAAYWNPSTVQSIPKGFQDSKALTDDVRSKLLDQLLQNDHIGFVVRALQSNEISRNMLRPEPYNLNQMSHDAAIEMIHKLVNGGVPVRKCFIDTVGNENVYRRKLEREFPTIQFVVEKKADAKYAECSAASVVAKVVRDRMLETWNFSEPSGNDLFTRNFGSGYPSDATCKKWFDTVQDPLFGYSNVVRFSWAPIKTRLKEQGVSVTFRADVDDEEFQQQAGMSAFLIAPASASSTKMGGGGHGKKRKRLGYFESRKLHVVNHLA